MQLMTLEVARNFTKVPNEVLEILSGSDMPKNHNRLLMFLIRHLYGYRTAKNSFTAFYIVQKTVLPLEELDWILKGLGETGAIKYEVIKNDPLNKGYLIAINTNYNEWLLENLQNY